MSHVIAEATDHPAPGAPLGPESLLWRIAADWRSGLSGLSAGMLELAWPHLGQGVEEHSPFTRGPYLRSIKRMKHIAAPRPEPVSA